MTSTISINQHDTEIQQNLKSWESKPLLREVYREFHKLIASYALPADRGICVELGSGIGNIKEVLPHCLRTDLFPNPWIDQTENAYQLSFDNSSVATIVLFDVFHHLRYPGTAFAEFKRVLIPGGRLIIFDPCMSLLGLLVYGLLHHEPVGIFRPISWFAPAGWTIKDDSYYAAQGNASRIFLGSQKNRELNDWSVIERRRLSALSYVASGGYGKAQMYPDSLLDFMRSLDTLCDKIPLLFSTRLLVVLENSCLSENGPLE
jgi:SAM-dependent methyltransferase